MTSLISKATAAATYLFQIPSAIWADVNAMAIALDQDEPLFHLPISSGTLLKISMVIVPLMGLTHAAQYAFACDEGKISYNILDKSFEVLTLTMMTSIAIIVVRRVGLQALLPLRVTFWTL